MGPASSRGSETPHLAGSGDGGGSASRGGGRPLEGGTGKQGFFPTVSRTAPDFRPVRPGSDFRPPELRQQIRVVSAVRFLVNCHGSPRKPTHLSGLLQRRVTLMRSRGGCCQRCIGSDRRIRRMLLYKPLRGFVTCFYRFMGRSRVSSRDSVTVQGTEKFEAAPRTNTRTPKATGTSGKGGRWFTVPSGLEIKTCSSLATKYPTEMKGGHRKSGVL